MFLSIDPENLKSVAQNAQRVNADIDSAMQLLNQISAHNDWNCKERKQLNEYTVQNKIDSYFKRKFRCIFKCGSKGCTGLSGYREELIDNFCIC